MAIEPVHCPVSRTDVVRVTDFEGRTTRVVCAEYNESDASCRLKSRATLGGPLARLIERTQEGTLATHGVRCDLA